MNYKKETQQINNNRGTTFSATKVAPQGRTSVIIYLVFLVFLSLLLIPQESEAATISRPQNNLGLVGYWSFDVGKGGSTAYDQSGQGNDGTFANMDECFSYRNDMIEIIGRPIINYQAVCILDNRG